MTITYRPDPGYYKTGTEHIVDRIERRKFRRSRRSIRIIGNSFANLSPRNARRLSRHI